MPLPALGAFPRFPGSRKCSISLFLRNSGRKTVTRFCRDCFSRALPLAAAAALFLLAACTSAPERGFTGTAEDRTAEALGAVNALRESRGLPALAPAPPARAAALQQARRMAANGRMKHLMGFGETFGARMAQSGVPLPAAENIGSGQQTAEAVVKAWIASPHHLENMLGPAYGALGVAVARDPATGNRPYWAMVLSR